MADSDFDSKVVLTGTKLSPTNYNTWVVEMEGRLMKMGALSLVEGTKARPTLSSTPTAAEQAASDAWELLNEKAAGEILTCLTPSQHVHITAVRRDAIGLWSARICYKGILETDSICH